MLTFQEVRSRIRLRTAGQVDDSTIEAITRDKLKELWEARSWSFRKADAVLATVAPKTAGTATLNVDPSKVDGTGTAFGLEDVGCELRVGNTNSRYIVSAVNVGMQQLTLANPYVGTPFATSPYILQRSVYSLAADFGEMLSVTYWRPLGEVPLRNLDAYDGRRSFTSNAPWSFSYRGYDAQGVQQVEISPVPSAALGIHYVYKRRLPTLVDSTPILFSEPALIYLCACDALGVKAMEVTMTNPAAAQNLIAMADKYQALGQNALQDFRDQDLRVSGAAQAVQDEARGGMMSDDYAIAHDIYSPIL